MDKGEIFTDLLLARFLAEIRLRLQNDAKAFVILFKDTKETATKINTQKHKAFMAKRRWKVGSVLLYYVNKYFGDRDNNF